MSNSIIQETRAKKWKLLRMCFRNQQNFLKSSKELGDSGTLAKMFLR